VWNRHFLPSQLTTSELSRWGTAETIGPMSAVVHRVVDAEQWALADLSQTCSLLSGAGCCSIVATPTAFTRMNGTVTLGRWPNPRSGRVRRAAGVAVRRGVRGVRDVRGMRGVRGGRSCRRARAGAEDRAF
jgi:hypothetical protein